MRESWYERNYITQAREAVKLLSEIGNVLPSAVYSPYLDLKARVDRWLHSHLDELAEKAFDLVRKRGFEIEVEKEEDSIREYWKVQYNGQEVLRVTKAIGYDPDDWGLLVGGQFAEDEVYAALIIIDKIENIRQKEEE